LPLGFSSFLTRLIGAEALGFDTGIGHKAPSAVGASTLAIHGCLLCKPPSFQKACPGRIKITTKVEEEGNTSYRNQARGEEQSEIGWVTGSRGLISNRRYWPIF
jgi:hypothetical protein